MTMSRTKSVCLFAACAGAAFLVMGALVVGQASTGLNPADLLKPLADSWPSYSGDYTGRRFSALTQVNQSNVRQLSLAFTAKVSNGPDGGRAGPGGPPPTIIGGEGDGDVVGGGATSVRGAPVLWFGDSVRDDRLNTLHFTLRASPSRPSLRFCVAASPRIE